MQKYIIIIVYFLLISCGTMNNKQKEKVNIDSNISGAKIIVNGKDVGQTPFSIELSHCKDYNIIVEKNNYKPSYFLLEREADNSVFLQNVFFAGAIGAAIDDSNCASAKFKKNRIFIYLNKEASEKK